MSTNVTSATINNRTKKRLQIAFRRLMLGDSPSAEMQEYTGLGSYELKQHITSKMMLGMTWSNYGDVWVVEHLVSLCYFDLALNEQRKLAWDQINLIPIFKEHMQFKEGNLHFSLDLLEAAPKSETRDKLLDIVRKNLKILDKYFVSYIKSRY